MALVHTVSPSAPAPVVTRHAYADNLKVVLVVAVIVAHATIAWTDVGEWVFTEPPLREPLLSLVMLVEIVGALFAIPLFFMVAGMFTPRSLQRKGLGRFLIDRSIRLGIPMLFFILVMSPPIEYVDPGNADWDARLEGFWAFVPEILWPPAPGPTWFLGVLLLFSTAYAVTRTLLPARSAPGGPRLWVLGLAAAAVAVVGYFVRIRIPFGEEAWRLALGQAPAWVVGFSLGVLGGERRWFHPMDPRIARITRRTAWVAMSACVLVVAIGSVMGTDIETFAGGGTWQSALLGAIEGLLVVGASFWIVDLFRRRFDHQGRVLGEMSRAAYGAFLFHQIVLVGLVLLIHQVTWAPELEYVTVTIAGVVSTFAVASLLLRIPGVSRIV
ncbi:MAG TPA: acyltransferase [Acidimicrobiia bacterium]|nr:acyltransferase [Acidimicrobiia bacterium]